MRNGTKKIEKLEVRQVLSYVQAVSNQIQIFQHKNAYFDSLSYKMLKGDEYHNRVSID